MIFTHEDWTRRFGAANSFGHAVRSGGAGNTGPGYDPESLLTGAEAAAGLTYADPRDWPDEITWVRACQGRIPASAIPALAPRVRKMSWWTELADFLRGRA